MGKISPKHPRQSKGHRETYDFCDIWYVGASWDQEPKFSSPAEFGTFLPPKWGKINPKCPQQNKDTQKRTIFVIFGMQLLVGTRSPNLAPRLNFENFKPKLGRINSKLPQQNK